MSVREIRTASPDAALACDVCGRTLLRGERSHPFLEGGVRRTVCELCTGRAAREGWVREGTPPSFDGGERSQRRRSLVSRLRARRSADVGTGEQTRTRARPDPLRALADTARRRLAEPRHVRAVPSGLAGRRAAAVEAFNASAHPRTVAGVARSLGLPSVAVVPDELHPGLVKLAVAWELCWYRYEVDLAAEEENSVRLSDQGAELHELEADELELNASCDADGLISLL